MFHRGLIVFERRVENLREEEILLRMFDWCERSIIVNFGSRFGGSARRRRVRGSAALDFFNGRKCAHQRTFDTERRAVIR